MPTERRFKRADADSVGDLRRASRTGELASFGPIGSKPGTGMIRHTAVASYLVGSVLSADCGRSSRVHRPIGFAAKETRD